MARRVVVFIDYENMHRCAASAFKTGNGHFWPWALGERLVAMVWGKVVPHQIEVQPIPGSGPTVRVPGSRKC